MLHNNQPGLASNCRDRVPSYVGEMISRDNKRAVFYEEQHPFRCPGEMATWVHKNGFKASIPQSIVLRADEMWLTEQAGTVVRGFECDCMQSMGIEFERERVILLDNDHELGVDLSWIGTKCSRPTRGNHAD